MTDIEQWRYCTMDRQLLGMPCRYVSFAIWSWMYTLTGWQVAVATWLAGQSTIIRYLVWGFSHYWYNASIVRFVYQVSWYLPEKTYHWRIFRIFPHLVWWCLKTLSKTPVSADSDHGRIMEPAASWPRWVRWHGPLNEAAMAAMARWLALATMFTNIHAIVLKNADLEEWLV